MRLIKEGGLDHVMVMGKDGQVTCGSWDAVDNEPDKDEPKESSKSDE